MAVVPAVLERGGGPRGEPVSLRRAGVEQGPGAHLCPCLDVGLFYSFLFALPHRRFFFVFFFSRQKVVRARRARRQTETPLLFSSRTYGAFSERTTTTDLFRVCRDRSISIDALVRPKTRLLCNERENALKQMNQCALPGERERDSAAGTPLVSGGEALFLLLLLLTISMCVSVLLSPESRRRRRERREREAREKARALRRERKRWNRSVTKGMWLEQPDGAVCVCVADADATTRDDGDASRSRRGRRARDKLTIGDASPGTLVPGDAARGEARAFGDGGDGGDGGSSTESSGGESDEGEGDAEGRGSLPVEARTGGRRLGDANNV